MANNLLHLPHEVLHSIIANTDPQDLAALCCCRALNDFIKNNHLLHKEMYLKTFDSLSQKDNTVWGPELRKLVNVQKILESSDDALKLSQLQTVAVSIQDLLTNAPMDPRTSLNLPFLTNLFEQRQNVNTFLCSSSLFEWARAELWGDLSTTRQRRDLAAMLTEQKFPRSLRNHSTLNSLDSETVADPIPEQPELGDLLAYVSRTGDTGSIPVPVPAEAHAASPTSALQRPQSYDRQLSAKLHCLYGVSIGTVRKTCESSPPRYSLRNDTAEIHPYARSRVYDLRQHTENGTFWGPFLDDGLGTVDWEKLEAIMIILDYNLRRSTEVHRQYEGMLELQENPWVGATPHSFISPPQSVPMEPPLPLEAQDPYSVTGTWMRVVCFLDYTALYDFNFGDDQPERDHLREPIDTEEATRLITMKIHVTKIQAPGEDDGQQLPVVHFQGKSSSIRPSWDPNANSKIKGTVRLTPQGEVRWTTFSVFQGEERWRSEGIQIGGVRSARGVLGFWFDKDFDEHGPAGPTAFWKSHDGIEAKKPSNTHGWNQFTVPSYW
ncbi:hypothetical protein HO133_002491 [Letharia lupina]|uniref:F-box domain-containing protein n=1 Tax=Letharia lupina TaxID=560253 RepID=A0A8H6CCQ1_9LECA|nr:uncharacterized protein HO133_002491 [Letharia lupina]KAF6220811.1 hypothetical protein HO133_002491 [Letharia lupina]